MRISIRRTRVLLLGGVEPVGRGCDEDMRITQAGCQCGHMILRNIYRVDYLECGDIGIGPA